MASASSLVLPWPGCTGDGSPSLPGSSWRLCTPSGVHGPRGMWVNQPSAGTHWLNVGARAV